jgi:CheY-like chemotaxis protein
MEKVEPEKKRILVVDDDPIFIKLLSSLLADEFSVQTASSGEEAIDILKASGGDSSQQAMPCDLIITDLVMPGLSGFDVAEYVRGQNKEYKYTPVIVLTGVDTTTDEARKHGCAAYVPKSNLNKVKSMARILLLR